MDEVASPEEKQEVEAIRLFTFAELAATSGKKRKKPAKLMEEQLLLSFG